MARNHTIRLTEQKLYRIIRESINTLLMEIFDDYEPSPDYVEYEGEVYEALVDPSVTLVYYNGEWLDGESYGEEFEDEYELYYPLSNVIRSAVQEIFPGVDLNIEEL